MFKKAHCVKAPTVVMPGGMALKIGFGKCLVRKQGVTNYNAR